MPKPADAAALAARPAAAEPGRARAGSMRDVGAGVALLLAMRFVLPRLLRRL
jgi:hypothetical protein